jgi:hypothetical protein
VVAITPNKNLNARPLLTPLLTVPDLTLDALNEVIEGRALALMVRNWYPSEWCNTLVARLESKPWNTYDDPSARGIKLIGGAFFDCHQRVVGASIEDDCEYLNKAESFQRQLNDLFLPYAHPMLRLKDSLDTLHPGGCTTLRISGRPAFFGLLRRFEAGGEALPHTDNTDRDWPCPETVALSTQLFANTYLSKTAEGGRLQIWAREIPTASEYNSLRDGQTYGLRRDDLGDPDLEIDPPVGALVIGRARCIHAVTPASGGGARISSSSFLGVHPSGLKIYS